MKNIVFVCGTFDKDGGRPSSVGQQLYLGFSANALCPALRQYNCFFMNGGSLADLERAAHKAQMADAVIWLANVPNDLPKNCVKSIKILNQRCVLVTSKRSVEKVYSMPAVVQHALKLHSNLIIVFTALPEEKGKYRAQLIDPLGNLFWEGDTKEKILEIGSVLNLRVGYLMDIRRMGTTKAIGSCPEQVPDEPEFIEYVRESAIEFGKLIPSPEPIERFVGNAAFRCTYGFPAMRGNGVVFVSQRNIDKTSITKDGFVPIIGETDNSLLYCGNHKPSVDAPIQTRVFQLYPKLKYMLHGHVYLKDTPITDTVLPCGALLEANEVWEHFPHHDQEAFALNLRGHGFIAGAADVPTLRKLTTNLHARPMPEIQENWVRRAMEVAHQQYYDDEE